MYAYDKSGEKDLTEFKEIVINLPKRFIYSSIYTDSDYIGNYMQFFIISKTSMTPNRIYIAYATLAGQLTVELIPKSMTEQNLQIFLNEFS